MADRPRSSARWERAKDARRAAMLEAAHALLLEVSVDELSVQMITERADLSLGTFYNLFGPRSVIVAKIYANQFDLFAERFASADRTGGIDDVFTAIRTAVELYRTAPDFYKSLAIRSPRADPELIAQVQRPQQAFWEDLLTRAVQSGDIVEDARPDLLGLSMLQISAGVFASWSAGLVTLELMELQQTYTFALMLLSVATEQGKRKLKARLAAPRPPASADLERAK